jgi:hypothetical protein
MNDTTIWEEKNLIVPEKNCLNNKEAEQNVIINVTKNDLIPMQCNDTGKKHLSKIEKQRIIQKRYYDKHKEKILATAILVRANQKLTEWKKLCPECKIEMFYTNKSNLAQSIYKNLKCKSCRHKKESYKFLHNYLIYICKRRKIHCDITFENLLEFTKIKKCTYCDAEIQWPEHKVNKNYKIKCRYNLDRKNNNLGYTKENCCVCCSECNSIKSDRFTYEEMLILGKTINQIIKNRSCQT